MSEKKSITLYFPTDIIEEMQAEAKRLDRSVSWLARQAWKIVQSRQNTNSLVQAVAAAHLACKALPDVNEADDAEIARELGKLYPSDKARLIQPTGHDTLPIHNREPPCHAESTSAPTSPPIGTPPIKS